MQPFRVSASRVPLQAKAVEALDRLPASVNPILFPSARGARIDFRVFGRRHWRPAQLAAGIEPIRGRPCRQQKELNCKDFAKPSDRLEPSTPSLPSEEERAGTSGSSRARKRRKP